MSGAGLISSRSALRARRALLSVLGFLMVALHFAAAQTQGAPASPPGREDAYANFLAKNATLGPATIALRDQAVLTLPSGFAFLPEESGKAFMKRLGNDTDSGFIGILLPQKLDNGNSWFSVVDYAAAGYIKDDDAKNWNADDLLKSVRDNTEAENSERRLAHTPELEILGWVEKPHYDAATRHLIWSISARTKGDTNTADNIINYRTLALGRQGYIQLNMVTALSKIEAEKPTAAVLLSNVKFNSGRRYNDFNISTDKVAEYGLAALIGGIVVHKLGLFALMAAMLVKFAKVIGLAVFGALVWLRRFFGFGKKKETVAPQSTPAVTDDTFKPG
jgi:uncharacterized membrane-anchored protein